VPDVPGEVRLVTIRPGENSPGISPLVDRGSAMTAIGRLLDRARTGHGGCLFLVGEPGLGKTALLDYACDRAADDFSVGVGRGDAMEQSLPFGLMSQAIAALGGGEALAPLSAAQPDRPPADVRAACFFGVQRWLEARAGHPLVFALDDLHWSDRDSLGLFHFLCRRIESLPVAVVGTLRPWPAEARKAAAALAQGHTAFVEMLAPLTLEGSAALLAARAGRPVDDTTARSAWQACAGNPLLLEQVAVALGRGEQLPRLGERAGVIGAGAAVLADELLLARFAGLAEETLRCAQAASVLGTRFRPDHAAEMAHLEPAAQARALDALLASGLVKADTGLTVEFAHPLFRQALYADLAAPVRARLHSRAAAVLLTAGLDGDAAEHIIAAEPAGGAGAVAVLERTAQAALASGAMDRAGRYLSSAARLAGSAASPALLLKLAEARVAAGQLAEASESCEQALAHPAASSAQRIEAQRMLGRAQAALGAGGRAASHFDAALRLAGTDDADAAVILLDQAMTRWRTEGPAVALPLAERARKLCSGAEPATRRRAESIWGFLSLLAGDGGGLQACADAAGPVPGEGPGELAAPGRPGDVVSTFGWAATIGERLRDGERIFAGALRAVEERGWIGPVTALATGHAHVLMRLARLPEALAAIQRASDLQEPLDSQDPYTMVGHACILHLIGDAAGSEMWCARAADVARPSGHRLALLFITDVRGQRALRRGDLDEARGLYEEAEKTTLGLGLGDPCAVPWAAHALAAHIGCGQGDAARRVIGWLEDAAASLPCRWPRIAAATGRAWLAAAASDLPGAETEFGAAVALHDEAELPLARIETLLDYGVMLRRSGQVARARPLLAEALRRSEEAAAGWFAGQAGTELAMSGGRRQRSAAEPSRLTPAERRVAALAATGHSNQEIAQALWISVNTVETHLRRVFAKLGVRSRRQLMTTPSLLADEHHA
jgi:DNA-binding CsgD family transcriptional regulator